MKANHLTMSLARAELDQRLNQVLVLVAPDERGQATQMPQADEMIRAHMKVAREALDRFEEACRG